MSAATTSTIAARDTIAPEARAGDVAARNLYRSVWRWHFYAGLFALPFLLMLAVTGSIYLFQNELNDALYPQLHRVTPAAGTPSPEKMVRAAEAAYDGIATRIDLSADPSRSAEVFLTPRHGAPLRVFVDPGNARVLGTYRYERTLVGAADRLHGSLMLGRFGDALVELAACWTLVLIATGLWLWWPRDGDWRRALRPDLRARGRAFWRGLHASTGAWTAAFIVFLVLTGLPWAGVWGDLLRWGTDALGIGYPGEHGHHAPAADARRDALPWTLQGGVPASGNTAHAGHRDHAGHGSHADRAVPSSAPTDARRMHSQAIASRVASDGLPAIGADAAVAIARSHGLRGDYRVTLPDGAHGAYTVVLYPARPQGQRTLRIDRRNGDVLGDTGYADYGWAARAVELGVQIHMGRYFGRANQIAMLLPCLGIVALSPSGAVMWWRRRPRGRLGAPASPRPARLRTLLAMTAGLGLLFPLVGASLLLVLLWDRAVTSRCPRLRRALR